VVRVGPVEPPGLLKTRVYANLVDQDAAGARVTLLDAVRGVREKPAREPEFPGAGWPVSSVTEAPRIPGELPPVWNVPFHPNPFFTGRDSLLVELHTRLNAPDMTTHRVALTGLGGVGKTQLAVEHAYRQRADYEVVWWMSGEQSARLRSDYVALAWEAGLSADLGLADDAPHQVAILAVRNWLEHHQRWLLVLDNIDDPQAVADLLPRSNSGHVVLTSRAETGWEPLAVALSVDVLETTDAATFLMARTRDTSPTAMGAATTLANTLGGLPLALEQAGAYIVTTGTVTLPRYAELFASRALELLQRGQLLGYQHTVATTWSLALQRLNDTDQAAVGLLTLVAFLAPDDLPLPLLVAHPDRLPEPLASAAGDLVALGDAVAALRCYSLIRVIGDGLFMHRLLQTVVRASCDANSEAAWVAAAIQLLRTGLPDDCNDVTNWPQYERLIPHVLTVTAHGQRLGVEPEGGLWLLAEAGYYLWSRGQYRQALALEERALAARKRVLGEDHPDTLSSMNNLAETLRDLGELEGACRLHEQALSGFKRVFGEDHSDTLTSMNNLASTLRVLGDLKRACELHKQALAAFRRVLGDDHPKTLISIDSLAEVRRDFGDVDGARELHEQALAGFRRVLGDDHPDTLRSMNYLAETRRALGDSAGARRLHEQTLVAGRRVLGDNHPTP
jgi:tetratricopeptide (TPR) repeat protein